MAMPSFMDNPLAANERGDHTQSFCGESTPEPRKGRMIGSRIIEGKPEEFFERDAIIDLGLQFGIGIDFKPLLKEQAFHENHGRIGLVA